MFLFFQKKLLQKIFSNIIIVPNSLEPDKAQLCVEPNLSLVCLQRFTADDKIRFQKEKLYILYVALLLHCVLT